MDDTVPVAVLVSSSFQRFRTFTNKRRMLRLVYRILEHFYISTHGAIRLIVRRITRPRINEYAIAHTRRKRPR